MTLWLTREPEPEGEGTRVRLLGAPSPAMPRWKRWLVRLAAGQIRKTFERNIASLRRLLAEISH